MDEPIVKNKRIFEKQLIKSRGFEAVARSRGMNPHAMLYLPEFQLLVAAGIHEADGQSQKLTLYKVKATVDLSRKVYKKFKESNTEDILRQISRYKRRSSALNAQTPNNFVENPNSTQPTKGKAPVKKTNSGQSKNVQKPFAEEEIRECKEVSFGDSGGTSALLCFCVSREKQIKFSKLNLFEESPEEKRSREIKTSVHRRISEQHLSRKEPFYLNRLEKLQTTSLLEFDERLQSSNFFKSGKKKANDFTDLKFQVSLAEPTPCAGAFPR